MRKAKAKVLGLLALATLSGTAIAGQTSVDVPVSIDYSGGCVLNLPSSVDLGTFSTIDVKNNKVVALNPFSFTIKCTQGVNYTINGSDTSSNVQITNTSDANSVIRLSLAKTPDYSQWLAKGGYCWACSGTWDAISGTGDGSEHTITLYPVLGAGTPGSASSSAIISPSQQPVAGTYTGTLTLKVSW
ncbi:hypothetical protein JCM14244_16530 [Venenivibrio stagnispumantis]|uniref:Spore coat protein U domain-containing protein n=1 Tax=Venenivibrio stagnispumantis TaxID=407998 RepID=A0AA45WPC3_9AQUI|nr:hypothetical protein [Venenivibrio stagnispumantis]MCW4573993.1 hypothetical protein [Venenivibrio stagnispumantis]SMP21107.1 hypothetical protein SAMN06264868_1229 [Venenivibrio stagnispumantis]